MNQKFIPNRWKFPLITLFSGLFLTTLTLNSCEKKEKEGPNPVVVLPSAADLAFRNSVDEAPADYQGTKFELSHDYPSALPKGGEDMPWLQIEVSFDDPAPKYEGLWEDYANTIFEYVTRDQDSLPINEIGWRTKLNGKTAWYHVPWMAYDPNAGREFAHGCTSERVASQADLDGDGSHEAFGMGHVLFVGQDQDGKPSPTTTRFETWAVGMYNAYAGYAIGQVFPASGEAQVVVDLNGKTVPKGLPFPVGSCVVKTLFTTASEEDAPFLKEAPEWIVHRHVETSDTTFGCDRELQPVHLVQMDVAVVDPRSPTGWVFGTFAYGYDSTKTSWKARMQSVGIQYGNDPQSCPAVSPDSSARIHQSVLNEGISIYQHYGCGNRLDGPVDNPLSSCMSCHAAAFTAPLDKIDDMHPKTGNIPPLFYFPTMCDTADELNKDYFANRRFPESYNERLKDDIPLDFSLQLWVAFDQYKKFAINGQPDNCVPANTGHDTVENQCQ